MIYLEGGICIYCVLQNVDTLRHVYLSAQTVLRLVIIISTRRARSMSWFQPHSCRDKESSNTWNSVTIVVIIIKAITILTIGHESAMFCLESGLYSISSSGTHFLTYTTANNFSHFTFQCFRQKYFTIAEKFVCHTKRIKKLHFTRKNVFHLRKNIFDIYNTGKVTHFNSKNEK